MHSLIAPLLCSSGKAKEIFINEIERIGDDNLKTHELVIAMMESFANLKCKTNKSVHGRYFEYVIDETLAREGVKNLYYQAKVRHVPLAVFDWFMYHETHPVSVSCKTKARDRWEQVALEAITLKRVYLQAKDYRRTKFCLVCAYI